MNLCKTESMSVALDDRDAFYIYVVFILKKKPGLGVGWKEQEEKGGC